MKKVTHKAGRFLKHVGMSGVAIGIVIYLLTTGPLADTAEVNSPAEQTNAVTEPNEVSKRALTRLQENSSENWRVKWHPTTGLPEIEGGRLESGYSGTPEEVATAFVNDYKDFFWGVEAGELLEDHGFTVSSAKSFGKYSTVVLHQNYKEIFVSRGRLIIRLNEDMTIDQVSNRLKPIELANTVPNITADEADQIASQYLGSEVMEIGNNMKLAIVASNPPSLQYRGTKFLQKGPDPQDLSTVEIWNIAIDALSGEVIWTKNSNRDRDDGPFWTPSEDVPSEQRDSKTPPEPNRYRTDSLRWYPDGNRLMPIGPPETLDTEERHDTIDPLPTEKDKERKFNRLQKPFDLDDCRPWPDSDMGIWESSCQELCKLVFHAACLSA